MATVRDISAPIRPVGDPMGQNLGPGAWADRADVPDLTYHGEPKVVPMAVAAGFSVATEDSDPRGMRVVGCDGKTGGTVVELWVDKSEPQIRYLELGLQARTAVSSSPWASRRSRPARGWST